MLTIEKATIADSGKYYVKAGNVEMEIQVIVKDMFRQPLVDVTIMEGLDAKFEFETEETNVPVQWFYKTKEIIHKPDKIQIHKHLGRKHALTILKACEEDSGSYIITIRGCDHSVELNVKASQKPQVLSIDQSEEYADCAFWDFAGQKEFYATHQTFLSANAVYLLVVDISEDFKSKTYENMIEKEFDTIGEYIDFWLDNIHCYCTDDKKTAAQENLDSVLNPPVIIVGTGIDKIPQNEREERKQKFLKYLDDTMSTQPKRRHFRKPHFLSNTYPSYNKQEFEELRKDIFFKAKDLSNWEENLPVRWVVLEKEICSIKVKKDILHAEAEGQTPALENKKVMFHTEAQSLADECSFPNVKQETSELDSFLKYEHEIGNIVFFKEVKEYIVLDPKWLVDVFRCFVSNDYNDDTLGMTEWDVLTKTGKLEDTLIETLLRKIPCLISTKHKQYLVELMEEFGIIVKPKNNSSMNDIYMPCMIKPRQFQEMFGKIDDETEYCKQSSWFCLVFDFLPPSYFNHVLVSFVKNNQLFYDKKDRRLEIYRNGGIFQLNISGSKILVICLSKNLIAMKVVQCNSSEDVCYSYIKTQLINLVDSIKLRYCINVNYEIRFKCQGGSLYDNEGIGYDEAMEKSEYRCTDHNGMHSCKDIYRYWLKVRYNSSTF
ncbi:uncharacterized protein LOC134694196 [Mytilus trossulus]|uniref:uncharacterized protein LOC134694196 n=1 Tax=Mytilus trossulus TaxID=6551 RepID=UPI003005C508